MDRIDPLAPTMINNNTIKQHSYVSASESVVHIFDHKTAQTQRPNTKLLLSERRSSSRILSLLARSVSTFTHSDLFFQTMMRQRLAKSHHCLYGMSMWMYVGISLSVASKLNYDFCSSVRHTFDTFRHTFIHLAQLFFDDDCECKFVRQLFVGRTMRTNSINDNNNNYARNFGSDTNSILNDTTNEWWTFFFCSMWRSATNKTAETTNERSNKIFK